MNSRHNPTSRLFLIVVFACAFFVGGTEIQARASDKGARLIVQRAANFGNEIAVDLSIDGKRVAYIQRDHRYDGFVSGGHHVLTVLPMPNVDVRRPTSLRVNLRQGRTYIFTAVWEPDRGVVLRRATFAIN